MFRFRVFGCPWMGISTPWKREGSWIHVFMAAEYVYLEIRGKSIVDEPAGSVFNSRMLGAAKKWRIELT